MPIPGSVLNSQFPFGIDAAAGMYPSVAVLRPITKSSSTTGQEKHTFADSTTVGQFNLPCRKSPLILVRPQTQERNTSSFQRYEAKFQVNFNVLLDISESLLVQWQVKVDGLIFQIVAVERDGSGITTRLLVSDALPYNA